MLNIVLVNPEIPMNTGNIARTCAATDTRLHLIEPLGFSISDSAVKRAGLDYWHLVDIRVYPSFSQFQEENPGNLHLISTKGRRAYTEAAYSEGDFLVFGRETAGLPGDLLEKYPEHTLRIPIVPEARSLNLANSAAIVLFEALRQLDFPNLKARA